MTMMTGTLLIKNSAVKRKTKITNFKLCALSELKPTNLTKLKYVTNFSNITDKRVTI